MKKIAIVLVPIIILLMLVFLLILFIFPMQYKNEVKVYSDKYNLSTALVMSVIKVESGFDKDAVSVANARGLMQLLPSTAEEIAGKLRLENYNENSLFEPSINIEIGCYYLSYLLNIFDGNITNSLCAYNWGMYNVKNWILAGNVDSDNTITNIPVEETKWYVEKIGISRFVYSKIYGYK